MPDAAAMGLEPAEIKAIITRMKRAHGHLGSVIRHDGGGARRLSTVARNFRIG
jgi:hypothetical protein